MKYLILFVTLIFTTLVQGQKTMEWPDLNEVKFTAGRAATENDINSGAAVFLLQNETGESIGVPIDIEIPQYAIHKGEAGVLTKVIIVQAEQTQDQKAIGALNITDNSFMVGLYNEFTFIGKEKPSE